ncbi:phosphatidate cytidylyltransferase [Paraglaciecola psychrophila 170]|nr:phosphatidate cytidylyltransferase [Paraglaciecola psychrophila 170]
MLKQRIITALILAPLALFAILYLPLFSFQIMIAIVMGLGALEWSSMSGMTRTFTKSAYAVLVVSICLILSIMLPTDLIWYQGQLNSLYTCILLIAAIWWIVSLAMIIAYPRYSSVWYTSKILRGIFGF